MTDDSIPEIVVRRAAELIDGYLLAREAGSTEPWDRLEEVVPKVDALLETNKRTAYEFIEMLLQCHYATLETAGELTGMTPYELWRATGERFKPSDEKGGDASV